MKTLVIWVILSLFLYQTGLAQCGEETYQFALAQAGNDIVLVRDFKVKIKEGTRRNPTPSSRFNVLMQKGLTYRFTISKNKSEIIEPILQLFDRNELLGSTYDTQTSKNIEKFEYLCTRTGNYQVFISIRESKAGCAVGLMSMVIDSAFYAKGNKIPEDERYVLYTGIENPLHIYTDQKEVKRVEITTDKGEIIRKDSMYYALIPSEGKVTINVKLFNNSDTVIEELDQVFRVVPLPKPKIKIEGLESEYLSVFNISPSLKLVINPKIYKIQEFYLSRELSYNSGYRSDSEYFTYEMIDYLKTLKSSDKIYIKEIRVVAPNGTVDYYGPITYYIR